MAIRSQSRSKRAAARARRTERGAASVQILVLMVPVLFGLMGFAVDLGRLYLVRGELKAAANSMALAAAQQLIGTESATENATLAARRMIETESGFGNKYDFSGLPIGQASGNLTSTVEDPTYYDTSSAAIGESGSTVGGEASGATARYVRVQVNADAPLLWWSFLAQGLQQRTPVFAQAVAGVSAPLCQACGIEPIAIAPQDPGDETHWGFVPNTRYTLGYVCNGGPQPGPLSGTTLRVPYLILNRLNQDTQLFADESSQLYRIGAQGLPPSTNTAVSCLTVNGEETVWATAAPIACNQNRVEPAVTAMTCGLASRLEAALPATCENIGEVGTLSSIYTPDLDVADLDDYTAYTGTLRRVLTVAIVETLTAAGSMRVLGFRQFLLEPNQNATNLNPADANARFTALYMGSPVPLRQGRFDGCTQTAGPGKVVLFQ